MNLKLQPMIWPIDGERRVNILRVKHAQGSESGLSDIGGRIPELGGIGLRSAIPLDGPTGGPERAMTVFNCSKKEDCVCRLDNLETSHNSTDNTEAIPKAMSSTNTASFMLGLSEPVP